MFINNPLFDLMQTDEDGGWHPSEQGRLFLAHDEATLRKLDDIEGMLQLLELLAGREQARRADLLPEWQAFLHQHSKFASPSSVKTTLYARLYNLVERELITREGMSYKITEAGRKWLGKALPERQTDPRKSCWMRLNAITSSKGITARANIHHESLQV